MFRLSVCSLALLFAVSLRAESEYDIFTKVDPRTFRVSERGTVWPLVSHEKPLMEIHCYGEAFDSELIANAIDWIGNYAFQVTGQKPGVRKGSVSSTPRVLPVLHVGFGETAKKEFETLSKDFHIPADPGPQGFFLRQISHQGKTAMICWSPSPLGCRYGLLELLRSLHTVEKTLVTDIVHLLDAPEFPIRIYYMNFSEHLQNAYNPNTFFESEINRWTKADWEGLIDMISAARYNMFEFWLVPTIAADNDADRNDAMRKNFIETINDVIVYARRRGVSVHPLMTVNVFERTWHYHCPNDPKEKEIILSAWDFWTKAFKGYGSFGIFPGDCGGCFRNGCTKETYVDLALELSGIIHKNNPEAVIEIGTWGEPMAGWEVPQFTGSPEMAKRAMEYLLKKLPEFPKGTFVHINTGFSPDSNPNTFGGDGRPYARRAAESVPVLTWDYYLTEGEGTVFPHCRLRQILQRRKTEVETECYSGGICYTMSPKIQCLNAFCVAESWWNTSRNAEEILHDFGRLYFGEGNEEIGLLLEEFEVINDLGSYTPFSYSPERLFEKMNRLETLLQKVDIKHQPRLPIVAPWDEYVRSIAFFTALFRDLADIAISLETLKDAYNNTPFGKKSPANAVSVAMGEDILLASKAFEGRDALQLAIGKLRTIDVPGLKKEYWDTVYGIYDHIIAPVDPRTDYAMNVLFGKFNVSLAMPRVPSVLERILQQENEPFLLLLGGQPVPEWKLLGWDVHGVEQGESWSSCSEGILSTDTFKDEGYQFLILRAADGPKGNKKVIWINGRKIGEFVRTGEPGSGHRFVTKSYLIPEGALKGGRLEIKFTEPGIGIAGVALSCVEIQE